MNRQMVITAIVALACSSVILGAADKADTLQEYYHVLTPEPDLLTAIACQDNDFGCEHPDDPDKHKEVPLPTSVRSEICRLTRKTFEDQLYEGPTKYEDLFGYMYRIRVPKSDCLHLYVYQLKPIPWLSFRDYRFVLILHNFINDTISTNPVFLLTDNQSYCSRPWISFQDVLGDSTEEILLLTGVHRGTEADWMYQHIIEIENKINLHELGAIKTGIYHPFAFPDANREERYGYIVRILNKVDHNHFTTTVSCSKSKQTQGEIILGREEFEVQENKGLSRQDGQVLPGLPPYFGPF